MTATVEIKNFPAHKVDAAREALTDMYAKLAKSAAKAGATPLPMPTLEASAPASVFSCSKCKFSGALADLGRDCSKCKEGYFVEKKFVDLTVTAAKPALAGWEFLAVVEPMDGGNMVRRVPGSDMEFDLTGYRSGEALSCEHCNTVRRRTETFVVRADGSDPSVAAGTVKRVGRNCLAAFLGGKNPEWLLRGLTIEKVLGEMGEDDGGGGWGRAPMRWAPLLAMSWSCSVVRLRGWVSKGAVDAYYEASGGAGNKVSTASRVESMLGDPPWDKDARAEWLKDRAELEPTATDVEKATAVLEWVKTLAGSSDYEYNLSLVCKQEVLEPKNLGIFVSAVGSYDRAMGKELAKKTEKADKVAAPLGKVEFEGEVIKTSVTTSRFGYNEVSVDKMTVKVTTSAGVWLAWGTIPASLLRETESEDEHGTVEANPAELVGRKLKITATLEAGKDAHFVFMKRPSVEFADLYNHPVYKAPKAPRKPRTKKVAETTEKEST